MWTLPNGIKTLLLSILAFWATMARCQESSITPVNVAGGQVISLRAEMDGRLTSVPILTLGGDERVLVSFDEMSHEYHRYVYRLEHCDFNWQTTEDLFYSEYADYTREEVLIEDYTESQNVTTLYTHYSFEWPNEEMRPLVSGNYRLKILLDEGDDPVQVAEVCIRVVERMVGINASVTTNTEVDMNDSHQQVVMEIDCGGLAARDLREEIHTIVLQNDRFDNSVKDAQPSYINGGRLIWDHQRDLVFAAGNEYRKFEILSARYPGLHTENIRYHAPYLHATIMTDEVRRNYLAAEDQNGINVIRNVDNYDDVSETEYMLTHFELKSARPVPDADVYLNGAWTTGGISPEWKLAYDPERGAYVGTFMLKQGYYNYQYLVVPRNGERTRTRDFEGDFYQTENDYRILVYYRHPGARYDRLVGEKRISCK